MSKPLTTASAAILPSLPEIAANSRSVQHSIDMYCSLFFHPSCSGHPVAYRGTSIFCSEEESCGYALEGPGSESLGSLLSRSEFQPKQDHPTFLY